MPSCLMHCHVMWLQIYQYLMYLFILPSAKGAKSIYINYTISETCSSDCRLQHVCGTTLRRHSEDLHITTEVISRSCSHTLLKHREGVFVLLSCPRIWCIDVRCKPTWVCAKQHCVVHVQHNLWYQPFRGMLKLLYSERSDG